MTDYTITVPSGSPDAIKKAPGQLRKVVHDLDTHTTMINAEQSGMAKAWRSPGGKAATTEAGTICSSATSYSGHINNGATALTTFATALDTAQSTIGGLQKQATGVPRGAVRRRRNTRSTTTFRRRPRRTGWTVWSRTR